MTNSAGPRGRLRPAGISPGTVAFLGAWIVGAAIARLTGSAAVLLLLAGSLVALGAAVVSGALTVRRTRVTGITAPMLTTVGTETRLTVAIDRADPDVLRLDGYVRLLLDRRGHHVLATIPLGEFERRADGNIGAGTTINFDRPGVIEHVVAEVSSSGAAGLMWFRRRTQIDIEPLHVAPIPSGPSLPIEKNTTMHVGDSPSRRGPRHGDIDGVRPWREGDGRGAIHWPSTLRSGSLIVHDRTAASDQSWTIDTRSATGDGDGARIHFTILEGLRNGHDVLVRHASGSGESAVMPIRTTAEARLFAARHHGPHTHPPLARLSLMRRQLSIGTRLEQETNVGPIAQWLTALASFIAIAMLLGALDGSMLSVLLAAIAIGSGAAISLYFNKRDSPRPLGLRIGVGVATFAAIAYIASGVGGITGLLAALRGPMPELLMLLVVLHGFEIADRRTLRVHQAIGSAVVAYATGLRIDDRVGLWMAAWTVVLVAAVRATQTCRSPRTHNEALPSTRSTDNGVGRRVVRGVAFAAGAAASTIAILSIVPVPDGPARLGLPALSNDAPTSSTPGGLAGPDGGAPVAGDGTRGSLGQVGGYPGFSESLDTSVRGDLGDDIVMRVRAPEPAFWRGQTFTNFDGRTWTVSPEPGTMQQGPTINVAPTIGDAPRVSRSAFGVEEFVQTYYMEADLPNVVFAAARASSLVFDGDVWTRPDGAMRSNVSLTEGSVYTVVSDRVQVTPTILREQGDVGRYFASLDNIVTRSQIQPFLDIPASTTARTFELASTLRTPGESTYDTILAYQEWLSVNTEYDLYAPVPAPGDDAVDDYLFESQRGFCEQIASALAIMLRTQGIPTRIATGYIPGSRDRVSGVFEVRASDAHAWVEVWFPLSGWQSFDPTANVPLAGEADQGSVGADLIGAAIASVASRPVELGTLIGAAIGISALVRLIAGQFHRRRRGRWGLLQDRFRALSHESTPTNPTVARSFAGHVHEQDAVDVAELLDRAAFDPDWLDDAATYETAERQLRQLERV